MGCSCRRSSCPALPLWLVASSPAGKDAWRAGFWWLLIAAGLVVPSVLRTAGQGTLSSDLSMKTAALLIVAMGPLVALGLDRRISLRELGNDGSSFRLPACCCWAC